MKKRLFPLLLALALLLAGCAAPVPAQTGATVPTAPTEEVPASSETGETPKIRDATGFCAGFGRADITPDTSVPLGGMGNVSYNELNRMSNRVLDKLYASCVAVRDENGGTVLLFQMDMLNVSEEIGNGVRNGVSRVTGVPADHILVNATHTHSAPDYRNTGDGGVMRWLKKLYDGAKEAARDALADLDSATMLVGSIDTEGLNFSRRYYLTDGFMTDNYTVGGGEITGREIEGDPEMRILKFERKNGKDIVIANWQAHPTLTAGIAKKDISADAIGAFRTAAEENLGVHFLYLQGGAGNMNFKSRIPGEKYFSNHNAAGKELAKYLEAGLANMTPAASGAVRAAEKTFTAVCSHEGEEKLSLAQEVFNAYSLGNTETAKELAEAYGFGGYFEAIDIVYRSGRGESEEVTVYGYAFGDVGISACPFESFCNVEQSIRERSPFAFTLSCGYSNNAFSYMPADACFDNGGYECGECHFVRGTAEIGANLEVEILNVLHGEA